MDYCNNIILMVKKKDDSNLLPPSSKNIRNLKDMEFKFKKNSKYFSKCKNFNSLLPHVNLAKKFEK